MCPPLTQLEIVDTPCVASHEGRELSVLLMRLTVNQKTQTIEQTKESAKRFRCATRGLHAVARVSSAAQQLKLARDKMELVGSLREGGEFEEALETGVEGRAPRQC